MNRGHIRRVPAPTDLSADADTVVMAVRHRVDMLRLLRRSVSLRIVRLASCPVLLVHTRADG